MVLVCFTVVSSSSSHMSFMLGLGYVVITIFPLSTVSTHFLMVMVHQASHRVTSDIKVLVLIFLNICNFPFLDVIPSSYSIFICVAFMVIPFGSHSHMICCMNTCYHVIYFYTLGLYFHLCMQ